jgi:hypothetical protein
MQLILGQTLASEHGFIVIVSLAAPLAQSPATGRDTAVQYRGYALQPLDETSLLETWIDEKTLVIAQRPNLERVIDVHRNGAANLRRSAIAPHLGMLDTPRAVSFVVGLPGLYRDIPAPGNGGSSLRQAEIAMAAFDLTPGRLVGDLQLISANAAGYVERLRGLLSEASLPGLAASGNLLTIELDGLEPGADIRPLLKTLFIDMDAIDYSEAVAEDGNPPWLNFDVGENPNSIFINFEFSDPVMRARFAADHLPAGFTLAPIRILDGEEPRYFLVLNVYQSSGGLVEGARAEWSVFVNDPVRGKPRFLVIQAAAEAITADSVNLLTLPEPVSHRLEADGIYSYVGEIDPTTGEELLYFDSRISWPPEGETRVAFAREFVAANDYIYWGNAVADRGLYNASVYNREAVLVEAPAIELIDNSQWAEYVGANPVHTLVYLNPLDFVLSPWWNLDAGYLDVTDDYRRTLIEFKNQFYPMTVLNQAEAAVKGEVPALLPSSMAATEPETHYHFLLTDPEGLLIRSGVAGEFPRPPSASTTTKSPTIT